MSMVTVGKNGRVYPRLFDHDQCREWYAQGATLSDLADVYGVVPQAIKRVVDPETNRRMNERCKRFFEHTCEDCGGPCTKNWYNNEPKLKIDRVVCKKCAGKRRSEEALQARLDADGNLRCAYCHQWLPMAEFQPRVRTGMPRHECRECSSQQRKERRWANMEATRAYDREYHRRRREQQRGVQRPL